MEREQVFDLINGERIYQEAMPSHQDKMQQSNTPVAAWIIYMEIQLNRAKNHIYFMNERKALEFVRKCTAVGVACMEHNNTPPR